MGDGGDGEISLQLLLVSWQVAFNLSMTESSSALWLSFPHSRRAPACACFHARDIQRSLLMMESVTTARILPYSYQSPMVGHVGPIVGHVGHNVLVPQGDLGQIVVG